MATSKQSDKEKSSGQGFASMDEDKRKAAASKGGRSSGKSDQETSAKADQDDDSLDEGQELDELLNLFENDELLDLDPQEATEMIDEWHEILNESGDADLKEIGKSLKQFKKVLSGSKSKPADISEALVSLGEQVDEYANNAERGYKTKLHNLGKSLSRAGKSLAKSEEASEAAEEE